MNRVSEPTTLPLTVPRAFRFRSDVARAVAAPSIAASMPSLRPRPETTHVGYELIGSGMLILAGGGRGLPMDFDELERWTRVGFERGMRSRKGEL